MTKAEIVDSVYERVGGFSKKEAAEVVEAVFETMKTAIVTEADGLEVGAIAEGDDSRKVTAIKISGFGNFVVRAKPTRTGRNPQTGDPIAISARRVLTFKPSQVLKAILNPHKSSTPRVGRAAAAAGDGDVAG